jgi:hypothetical protein
VTRLPLKRLARSEYEYQPRYFHPNGYVIERNKRSWSERVGRQHGQADHASPMYWWEVRPHVARRRSVLDGKRLPEFLAVASYKERERDFATLTDARQWCDEHPRNGWE